jgi:hypothetical protein
MTQLVLGVAGYALTGSPIGFAIGSAIGAAIDAPNVQGPRLSNMATPDVQYGAKFPRVYGRVWRTLAPAWWSKLRESEHSQSAKGGPTATTFSSAADLFGILADGSNVVDWARIEIDGEIVQSRLAGASAATIASDLWRDYYDDFELFTGAAGQAPWSVMEAVEGIGQTSAYRDQCTGGFTNLQWRNGRQPSVIRIELVTEATVETGITAECISTWTETPAATDQQGFFELLADGVRIWRQGWQFADGRSVSRPQGIQYGGPLGAGAHHFAFVAAPTELRLYVDGNCSLVLPGTTYLPPVGAALTIRVGEPDGYNTGRTRFSVSGFRVSRGILYTGSTAGSFTPPSSFSAPSSATILQSTFVGGNATDEASGVVPTQSGGTLSSGSFVVDLDFAAAPFSSALLTYEIPSAGAIVTPGVVDLRDVLEAEMLRCTPLVAGDIDMSAAAGYEVRGIECFGSGAQAIQVLLDWYFLDIYCLDKITVVRRGGASEQTIPFAYTGAAVDGQSEPFAGLKRGNDVEVGAVTIVNYVNQLADGETGSEEGDRISSGSKINTAQCNIYALPTEAKGRAQAFTRDARVVSHTATVRFSSFHGARRQPGSIVTLSDNKGLSYRVRIPRLTWNGQVYECDVLLDDLSVLTPTGITSEAYTSNINVPPTLKATFLALDNPPLPGADTAGYLALVKTEAPSAEWVQNDVATGDVFVNDAIFGVVTAITGTPTADGFFDEVTRLTVNVATGVTLASATREALLSSRATNAFIAGTNGSLVVGQFRTATAVSDGVFTLSGFLWGQKGTEQYADDVGVGDNFALLGVAGTAHIERSVSQLGTAVNVKAVVSGRRLTSATAVAFTPNGESLKPRSPVQLRRTTDASSGDSTYTFNRRTRLDTRFGGALGDSVPLGEDSEAYRVRLYTDGTYTTIVHDLGTITAPTFAYSGSQRTTDYGSTTATAYIGITQLSAAVGEGYALKAAA